MNLTREQKLLKYEAIQEKKRRLMAAKPVYKPNQGQLAVHMDAKRIRIVAAGNGGGKTALGANETIWWLTGFNPLTQVFTKVPATVIVLLDNPIKVDQVWMPELRKWYPIDESCELRKNGKPYVNQIIFKNGSQIIFMTHDQEDLVFEGVQLDYLVADEPFPRRIWIALSRGQRKKGSDPKTLIIGTPIGQPWIYNDLWKKSISGERTDIGLHRFSVEVNRQNLADGYIEAFSANLTEQEKKVRLLGHFAHLEGLALAHLFDRGTHVVDAFPWPRGKPAVLVIDPHFAKPHVATLIGATGDGRIYYIKELKSKNPARAFAKELHEFLKGEWRMIDYVIDSLGETTGTGGEGNRSFAEVLRDAGIPVRSTSFDDKNDEDFIQRIQQVLEIPQEADNFGRKLPKLAVISGNSGIIEDIESCQWQKYRQHDVFKPKLDISSKDYLACLKYALSTNIAFVADVGKLPKVKRSRPSPWGRRR
jgi:hypothetical protein